MKLMNEHGKHNLRRSDRIRKNIQIKLLDEDPYHYHKKQCKLMDVFERKISLLEERVKALEKELEPEPEELEPEPEKPKPAEGFPWDELFLLGGLVWLVCYFVPFKLTDHYFPYIQEVAKQAAQQAVQNLSQHLTKVTPPETSFETSFDPRFHPNVQVWLEPTMEEI